MFCSANQQIFLATIAAILVWQASASDADVRLTHDGPAVLGSIITFKAELKDGNGKTPSGQFVYTWKDNAVQQHTYQTEKTSNTTTYYSVSYSAPQYHVGEYTMEVSICRLRFFDVYCEEYTSRRVSFQITALLNGKINIEQSNKTLKNEFVSSSEIAKLSVNLRKSDYDYIKKVSTSIVTYWFIDCDFHNKTNDFKINYNFTVPKSFHTIQALVEASFDLPPTTTIPPSTNSTSPVSLPINKPSLTLSDLSNKTMISSTVGITSNAITTAKPLAFTEINTVMSSNKTVHILGNVTYPYVCNSVLDADANKKYGYYMQQAKIRAPISKLSVEGSTWIQPWNSLSLSISCNGTGPFTKCIKVHVGKYNITGNETCDQDSEVLDTCKFSFIHYFLDPLEYTVLIIISNDIGTEIHPVAVNIYKLTPKPQLSVIVVPVSCSFIAVVAIVFGIAFYVQNRSRFTVEVADFDFGQNRADMEYKTFRERLRDSFNNAGYKQLDATKDPQ